MLNDRFSLSLPTPPYPDIDCWDDTHCVLIGEGFADDGSKSPGARIWTTDDGEVWMCDA